MFTMPFRVWLPVRAVMAASLLFVGLDAKGRMRAGGHPSVNVTRRCA
jgi:hypothetical protein